MKDIEKLKTLLPHWVDHNNGHEAECIKWAEIARQGGLDKVADSIDEAVKCMRETNRCLQKALEEAGGSSEHHHHHHHHH
jgi:hypothetical protein